MNIKKSVLFSANIFQNVLAVVIALCLPDLSREALTISLLIDLFAINLSFFIINTPSFLSFSNLFCSTLIIYHAGHYINDLFFNNFNIFYGKISASAQKEALIYLFLFTVLLVNSVIILIPSPSKIKGERKVLSTKDKLFKKAVIFLSILVFPGYAYFLMLSFLYFIKGSTILEIRSIWENLPVIISVSKNIFIYIQICLVSISTNIKQWTFKIPVVAILLNFIVFFMIGSRQEAMLPLIASLIIVNAKLRFINKKKISVMLLALFPLLFVIFPIITMARLSTYSEAWIRYKESITNVSNNFDICQYPLLEAGETGIGLAYSIENIPSMHNYWYGKNYLYSLLMSLPFERRLLGERDFITHSPHYWFNSTFDPVRFAQGGGWGYSILGEFFANFGWLSVFLAPIIAFLLYLLDTQINSDSLLVRTIIAILSTMVIFLPRASLAPYFKTINDGIILLVLAPYLISEILYPICNDKYQLYNK